MNYGNVMEMELLWELIMQLFFGSGNNMEMNCGNVMEMKII